MTRAAMSAETRRKLSMSQMGHPVTAETRAKISAAGRGRTPSAETRAKLAVAMSGRYMSPAHLAAMSAGRRSKWTPEFRAAVAVVTPQGFDGFFRELPLPERRAIVALRARARRLRDPGRRLHERVSAMVRLALREVKSGRSWEALVGYSRDDLARHLEAQFVEGMSWENMGEWHIDHIVPRSAFAFKYETDPGFRACWALTNLQPLWAADNLKKRATVLSAKEH